MKRKCNSVFDFYELSERIQGCSACRSGLGSHDKHVALASVIRNTKLVFGSFSARYILKHAHIVVSSLYSQSKKPGAQRHHAAQVIDSLQQTAFAYVKDCTIILRCMHTAVHMCTHSFLFSPCGIVFLWLSWKFLCLHSLRLGSKATDTWDS